MWTRRSKQFLIPILCLFAVGCGGDGASGNSPASTIKLLASSTFAWRIAGSFVRTKDAVLAINSQHFVRTTDGVHWSGSSFPDPSLAPDDDGGSAVLPDGRIVWAFLVHGGSSFTWDPVTNAPSPSNHSDLWVITSDTDGTTWNAPQRVQTAYCGGARSIALAGDGSLVLASAVMTPAEPTNRTVIYRSTNRGVTWQESAVLEIGGRGTHDGIFEGSVASLGGSMLLGVFRTNKDVLYQASSNDNGKTWSGATPTTVPASSSPGTLIMLKSGRLLLAYNPLQPSSGATVPRIGPPTSVEQASWFRNELLIRWSDDKGQTWSDPLLVIDSPTATVAYPQMVEFQPGVIWLSTAVGKISLQFKESDLVAK